MTKSLIVLGAGLIVAGRVLPGDMVTAPENYSFTLPLTTSIIISSIMSLILY